MRLEKWHGAGNDFLVADGRDGEPTEGWSRWATRACDRHRGIGADGLLVLGVDPTAGLRMLYWNADGSVAEMCGNGGRVLAAYAVTRGFSCDGSVRFQSAWGPHEARVTEDAPGQFRVRLSLPDVPRPEPLEIETPWGAASALRVEIGVPHLVIRVAEGAAPRLEEIPVVEWGRTLRRHPALREGGANVDFVSLEGPSRLSVRTYERGVEGETLACGTGAVAVAAAAEVWGLGRSPWQVTPWSGDGLRVSFEARSGAFTAVQLLGSAERIGIVEL